MPQPWIPDRARLRRLVWNDKLRETKINEEFNPLKKYIKTGKSSEPCTHVQKALLSSLIAKSLFCPLLNFKPNLSL